MTIDQALQLVSDDACEKMYTAAEEGDADAAQYHLAFYELLNAVRGPRDAYRLDPVGLQKIAELMSAPPDAAVAPLVAQIALGEKGALQ
jgi:hypothetical protein